MEYEITETDGIHHVTLKGTLTMAAMGTCFVAILDILGKSPEARILVDYTGVSDYQIAAEEARGLSDGINRNDDGQAKFKMAFVIPEDLRFGIGRLFIANVEQNRNYAARRRMIRGARKPSGLSG